ncbi:MAG: dihydropteroate synthase [Acidimicrobiia bacterium]|nr:dihydropteroate synthase [Acidimicrobiia bacterium]
MGIVNVTPDSFSDGGAFIKGAAGVVDHDAAIAHAHGLIGDGADLIDVGGESTRPGALPIDDTEEIERVMPVVSALAQSGVTVSVDTSKPAVAEAAVEAGAEIINDVTGLRNPDMVRVAAETGAGVVIMHMQGVPRTMQADPTYGDVVADVRRYLVDRAEMATDAGVARDRICIDPGIGFGKTFDHNLQLLHDLKALTATPYPVLVGTSRKRFLGAVLDAGAGERKPAQRDGATAATSALAAAAGVSVVRVHNVAASVESTRIADAIVRSALRQT